MSNKINQEITTEKEPAKKAKFFEQTGGTMEPQGEKAEIAQPSNSDSAETSTKLSIEKEKKPKESKKTDLLIRLAQENIELFHTPNDESFASIKINGHCENILVDSKLFCKFLMRLYYKRMNEVLGGQALKDAVDLLSAKALFDSPELALHLRIFWVYNITILGTSDFRIPENKK